MANPKRTQCQVLRFALGLPGAYEDNPWDEIVAKVNKKVFVFFGAPESPHWPGMTLKLLESHQAALGIPGAEPSGYGLGKSGWVNLTFRGDGIPPVAVLTDWVEESYRLVAPKRLIAELDARAGSRA